MATLESSTQVLTAAGYGQFVPCFLFNNLGLPPGILCILSPGAVLTYTIEVTGDNVLAPGYNPATANVNPADNLAGLSASANGALTGSVMAVRPHITSYTSGSLTFQFIQLGL